MEKGKHISLEDINSLLENKITDSAAEEKMLLLLEHIAVCRECAERAKAHIRLEMLLSNWTPGLHGLAFQKKEYEKRQEEKKRGGSNEGDEDEGASGASVHKSCSCEHDHPDDCDCGCNDEID